MCSHRQALCDSSSSPLVGRGAAAPSPACWDCVYGVVVFSWDRHRDIVPWEMSGAFPAVTCMSKFVTTPRGPHLEYLSVRMYRQAEGKDCNSKELSVSEASQSQLHISFFFFFPVLAFYFAWEFCCASLAGSQKGFSVWTDSGEVEALCDRSPSSVTSRDGRLSGEGKHAVMSSWEELDEWFPVQVAHWRNDGQWLVWPKV